MSTHNCGVNIFETIGKVTSRTEPFHSQFLADVLTESLTGDRSLFDAVWKLIAPPKWTTPDRPAILSEESTGNGRIDICIHDKDNHRVLGIEVKTEDSSAKSGQLEQYLCDLKDKYSEKEVTIAYLTPFNRKRAEEKADSLSTVSKFEEFSKKFPNHHGGHVSWLDVADISWDGNELWKQHQYYVRNTISSPMHLQVGTQRDRPLEEFFGEEATRKSRKALAGMVDSNGDIDLAASHENLSSLANCLVRALEELICGGDGVLRDACKRDDFSENLRKPFLDSDYREIHEALFSLSEKFSYVWIEGQSNYGVRVAHKGPRRSVSLITSLASNRLNIRQLR